MKTENWIMTWKTHVSIVLCVCVCALFIFLFPKNTEHIAKQAGFMDEQFFLLKFSFKSFFVAKM